MNDDKNSVFIDIKQSINYTEKLLYSTKKKMIKQTKNTPKKPSESAIKKYILPGSKPLDVKNFKRADFLLPCKLFTKSQEKERLRKRLAIKADEEYKIISTDMQNRLHVISSPNGVRAITDVDKDFYRYFDVRPMYNYAPLYKSFKCLLSKLIRIKQEIGYRKDNILNIEVNHNKELKMYNETAKRCTEQAKYFDTFISDDYQQSMACLNKWNDLAVKLNEKVLEMQCLAGEIFTTKSRLVGLDYMYGLQQKYGRFLYYLSPPSWRAKHREFARSVEIEAKGFDFGMSNEDDAFNVIFEKMKRECSSGLVRPPLYFEDAADLMTIFDTIGKQQQYHFTQVGQVAPHAKSLMEGIKILKELIAQDSISINNTIKNFETILNFDEERSAQLEFSFFKLVYGSFYNSVGAPEVLELQLHLNFCYEKVFSEKPMSMDIVTVARALESCYLDYNKRLDALQSGKIKMAVLKCIEIERHKFKRAKVAARELRNFSRLERNLRRACEPPVSSRSAVVPVVKRVDNKKMRDQKIKAKAVTKQYNITDSEKEYLTLFTDWTENEDPANYLRDFTDSKE
ncbi:uncharacterized protein LOC115451337 [Manduca sexta]|uniref:Uncharacterized protein n=1 Tax=Manduca sexta TaxID=7130 RepID=A0A921YMV1_MANSE|nr:uncharacterized protein LOC115451337 [Manduca sexta]KAG6442200.1 hypothetical protein O3G_MSEX002245 [Manduca sexta]